jgi:HlyD family secretion protein
MKTVYYRLGGLALLMSLALAGCSSQQALLQEKPTPTAAPVTERRSGLSGSRIVAGGKVVPAASVALSFASGGTVSQAPVQVGDRVNAGDVLAQLDTSALDQQLALAEANLAAAEARLAAFGQAAADADLAAAQQNVASAQATYERLAAGPDAADVAAAKASLAAAQQNYAAVRAGPQPAELAQLKAQAENARAALDQAQAAYDRVKGDPNIGSLPQSAALQQATNNYNAANAAYEAARAHPTAAELAAATAQVQAAQASLARLTPDAAEIQVALAAVENAKARLAQLERAPAEADRAVLAANVEAARASRDLAQAQLKHATLTAPFAGSVMKLDIAPGEYAAPGAAVLLLADATAWEVVTTDLTELNVAEVAEGAAVTVAFDAIPDLELPGRVSLVEPYGESKQGDIVYPVKVVLDRQDPRLRWNMTAKVSIESR